MMSNSLYDDNRQNSVIVNKNGIERNYTLSAHSMLVDGIPRLHIFKGFQLFKLRTNYLVATSGGYSFGHMHLIDISNEMPIKLLDWEILPFTENEIVEFYIRKDKFIVIVYSRVSNIDGTPEENILREIDILSCQNGCYEDKKIDDIYKKYYPNESTATCKEDMLKDITLWRLVPISFNSFDINILKKNAGSDL